MQRAINVTMSIAASLGLPAERAAVIQNSNKLALRLSPCDVFARVAPVDHQHARFEVPLALRLAEAGCPVAALDPRVEPRGHERDGFEVTLWTYYEPVAAAVAPVAYADALHRLHVGMRETDVTTPHFTDRVAHAEHLVAERSLTPDLDEGDRALLAETLRSLRLAILHRGAPEQLLHGEPHEGNLLNTQEGALFVDLETCCRGPIEFDLAHAPPSVAEHYPGVDRELLAECRRLVLAMVAVWRWDRDDQFPNGTQIGRDLIRLIRSGSS